MIRFCFFFSFILAFNGRFQLFAQGSHDQYLFSKQDTPIHTLQWYGALTHQHQDFFSEAFSFQGLETGVIINHNILFSVYGSAFASPLQIQPNNTKYDVSIWQTGICVGEVYNRASVLHGGWLVHTGYFSLVQTQAPGSLFITKSTDHKTAGMILSPEIYAELNILSWMKFRTGIAYGFYSFPTDPLVAKNDLQNISLDFGFVFGRF